MELFIQKWIFRTDLGSLFVVRKKDYLIFHFYNILFLLGLLKLSVMKAPNFKTNNQNILTSSRMPSNHGGVSSWTYFFSIQQSVLTAPPPPKCVLTHCSGCSREATLTLFTQSWLHHVAKVINHFLLSKGGFGRGRASRPRNHPLYETKRFVVARAMSCLFDVLERVFVLQKVVPIIPTTRGRLSQEESAQSSRKPTCWNASYLPGVFAANLKRWPKKQLVFNQTQTQLTSADTTLGNEIAIASASAKVVHAHVVLVSKGSPSASLWWCQACFGWVCQDLAVYKLVEEKYVWTQTQPKRKFLVKKYICVCRKEASLAVMVWEERVHEEGWSAEIVPKITGPSKAGKPHLLLTRSTTLAWCAPSWEKVLQLGSVSWWFCCFGSAKYIDGGFRAQETVQHGDWIAGQTFDPPSGCNRGDWQWRKPSQEYFGCPQPRSSDTQPEVTGMCWDEVHLVVNLFAVKRGVSPTCLISQPIVFRGPRFVSRHSEAENSRDSPPPLCQNV